MKSLVIIAGAAGEIGTAYIKQLLNRGIGCVGVVRNKKVEMGPSPLFRAVVCNLDNQHEVEAVFSAIDFGQYDQVVYLHTIGIDKFDPRNYPNVKPMQTIDGDVYNTNVNSFKYLFRYCISRVKTERSKGKNVSFKTAIIAGVADKYAPFVIESFCEAKFIVRQYVQAASRLYPEWMTGLCINITSTITKSALAVRPHADTAFWLTPEEVAGQSADELINGRGAYKEIDIIKNSPDFIQGYYENDKCLYEKWSMETGIH